MKNNIDEKLKQEICNFLREVLDDNAALEEWLDKIHGSNIDRFISAIKSLFPQELEEKEVSKILQDTKYIGMVKHYNVCKEWADKMAHAICSHFGIKKMDKNKFTEICSQLADDYFPKGQCKERGQLLVFIAQLLIKLVEEV